MALSLKMRTFCLAYVGEANGNGTEAARIAGYKGNDVTLAAVGSENLRKPQIVQLIAELRIEAEKKASDKILSAMETLVGHTKIAESDIADLFPDNPFLQEAQKRGISKLIKSIYFDKDTGRLVRLEMYSAQVALQDMAKHHGLMPTKIEISKSEADDLINRSGAPKPETFAGEPVLESEM